MGAIRTVVAWDSALKITDVEKCSMGWRVWCELRPFTGGLLILHDNWEPPMDQIGDALRTPHYPVLIVAQRKQDAKGIAKAIAQLRKDAHVEN